MPADYSKTHSQRLRSHTLPGELANMIGILPGTPTVNTTITTGGSGGGGGGGVTGSGTAGQVTFWTGASTILGDNGLFWNNTTKRLGIGTTSPGAQLNVTSAIEIFQTAALTAGSAGSLIVPIHAGVFTDALGGNLDGALGIDITNNRLYFRSGSIWRPVPGGLRPLLYFYPPGVGVGATPVFVSPFGANSTTAEAQAQMQVKGVGVVQNLRVYVSSNTAPTSITVTLRVNSANTALTITIGAGATGAFVDNSHQVTVNDSDLIDWAVSTIASGIVVITSIGAYF